MALVSELWDGSDCPSTAKPITYTYTFEINKNVAVSHMEITKILIDGRCPEVDLVTVLLQQNGIRDGSDKTVMLDNIATSYMGGKLPARDWYASFENQNSQAYKRVCRSLLETEIRDRVRILLTDKKC